MLQPRIELLSDKKLIGKRISMSLVADKTHALWQGFMPVRKEIKNSINDDLFCIRVYNNKYFENFDPSIFFDKWAAVEVPDFEEKLTGLESFVLNTGLYAVFDHKGSSQDHGIYDYIFGTWIPQSAYEVDHRPHFDLLGEKYKNDDPSSEEEIWIPIKLKK